MTPKCGECNGAGIRFYEGYCNQVCPDCEGSGFEPFPGKTLEARITALEARVEKLERGKAIGTEGTP